MPPSLMQNTQTHTHFSNSHSPSHPPTHTHTHPHRAHAKPAVSSVISSWRGSVTLNSWSVERKREGEKCKGEEKEVELVKGNKRALLLKAVLKEIV